MSLSFSYTEIFIWLFQYFMQLWYLLNRSNEWNSKIFHLICCRLFATGKSSSYLPSIYSGKLRFERICRALYRRWFYSSLLAGEFVFAKQKVTLSCIHGKQYWGFLSVTIDSETLLKMFDIWFVSCSFILWY